MYFIVKEIKLRECKFSLISLSSRKKVTEQNWTQWFTPVILAFWEAGAGRSQGQEIGTSLANMVKLHLY